MFLTSSDFYLAKGPAYPLPDYYHTVVFSLWKAHAGSCSRIIFPRQIKPVVMPFCEQQSTFMNGTGVVFGYDHFMAYLFSSGWYNCSAPTPSLPSPHTHTQAHRNTDRHTWLFALCNCARTAITQWKDRAETMLQIIQLTSQSHNIYTCIMPMKNACAGYVIQSDPGLTFSKTRGITTGYNHCLSPLIFTQFFMRQKLMFLALAVMELCLWA